MRLLIVPVLSLSLVMSCPTFCQTYTINTAAGNGTTGFSGDNGPATSAQLNFPGGVAVDSSSNIYIADTTKCRIREVSNGVITTVAGDGTVRFWWRQRPGHRGSVELSLHRRVGQFWKPLHRRYR